MIYLVEDDENIRDLVVYTLKSTGLNAVGFRNAALLWEALEKEIPELVLLDIMLPDEDGITILKKLRKIPEMKKKPIIMLTAKSSEYDKVLGLDSGADDYIPKPFGLMELVARVKAHLRRSNEDNEDDEIKVGSLTVSKGKHKVMVGDKEIILTLKEFELLVLLLENRDIVLTRDRILTQIWGYNFDGETRTVDVHIRMLRQKLLEAGDMIETIRGVGYVINK